MKDIIKPIAVLGVICLVVTALLAWVNIITSPIITAAAEKAAAEARSEVLSEAKDFREITDVKLPEGVTAAYEGSDNSGFVIMVKSKGYGGDIELICGIRPDGSIEAVKTLSHSETSGIGSKVVDNATGYRDNYKGKTKDDYSDVDGVTGATISSKAYKKAIGTVFEAYDILKEGAKA